MRITWIGHSTVLLELDGTRLLTDPVLRGRVKLLRRPGGSSAAPEDVDAALISHLHYDHLDLPSLELLDRDTQFIVPLGAGSLLQKRGLRQVVEVKVGDEVRVGPVSVRATSAEHPGSRGWGGHEAEAVGYLVSGSSRVYFAGDTDLFDGMSALAPGLDLALVPVSGWGLRTPPGHLDPPRAAEALRLLRPRVAVPIHWGTYRPIGLRTSSPRAPAESFARFAHELVPEVDVRILPVGGSLELGAEEQVRTGARP
jgi:L-ascorbate metabolism protein UlaG (beta-lactamase superfamily)